MQDCRCHPVVSNTWRDFVNTLQQGKAERIGNYTYQRRTSNRIYEIRMIENIRRGIDTGTMYSFVLTRQLFVGNMNGPVTEIVSYQNYLTGVHIREISRLYHVAK